MVLQLWNIAATCLPLQHLGALFTNALAQAADNFGTGDQLARKDVDGGTVQREGGTDLHAAVASENPLAGVVIFVSQKLIRKQGTYCMCVCTVVEGKELKDKVCLRKGVGGL